MINFRLHIDVSQTERDTIVISYVVKRIRSSQSPQPDKKPSLWLVTVTCRRNNSAAGLSRESTVTGGQTEVALYDDVRYHVIKRPLCLCELSFAESLFVRLSSFNTRQFALFSSSSTHRHRACRRYPGPAR